MSRGALAGGGWLMLAALLVPGGAVAQEPGVLEGMALIEALRGGGYNLYFRHAATDWSQDDFIEQPGDWKSCDGARVRQLSAQGRATARAVGEAMRALGVPVGRVLASPYCRTVETAREMGFDQVRTTNDVMNLRVARYFDGISAIAEAARGLLASAPHPGTNTLIAAHGNVAREATGVYPGEGEGLVFEPDGEGGFRFVGRLDPAQWAELARRAER